jgi:Cdc6-like AAA superfamily ATPase
MQKDRTFSRVSTPEHVKYVADLDPLRPGDPRYVPLEEVRRDHVPRDLYRALKSAIGHPKGRPAHICYAGHRGNGKTTELFKVIDKLCREEPFKFVYRAADTDLATSDLDYPDLMLYLARMALAGTAEEITVDDAVLEPIERWFAQEVAVDQSYRDSQLEVSGRVEAGLSVPGLLKLLTRLTSSIKGGHKSVLETRLVLRQQVSELIRRLNELFDILRTELKRKERPHELVLVIDNLDRLPPVVIAQAFNQWASLFEQLHVHMVMTVPLPLIYYPESTKLSEMGFRPLVLSMPKIRLRHQPWTEHWPEGVAKLIEIISARVDDEAVFAGHAVDRQACLERIVLASGGSLREIMRILTYAGEEAWDQPINRDHVERAVSTVRDELMSNLNLADVKVLHRIHRDKRADRTEEVGRQLFYRWALEYNGEKWADVHPLIFESGLFQRMNGIELDG